MNNLVINYTKIELSDDHLNVIKKVIPKTYDNISNFKSEEVKKQTLLSKYMIVKNIGCKEDDINYNQLKKPYVKNKPYFNLSHSKEYIVFVSSQQKIGIDIEYINKKHLNILNYAFNDEEINFIKNDVNYLDNEESRLTMLWTIKESLFKASSIEKYIEPKNIEVNLSKINIKNIGEKIIIENQMSFIDNNYYIYSMRYDNYIISVATIYRYDDLYMNYQKLI